MHAPQSAPPELFASLDFNLTGVALPPVDPFQCAGTFPDLSAGLLLFDILVANCDRHRGNLSADLLAKPPQMNVFDHSHALFGFHAGQGEARLGELRDRLGVSGGSHTHGNRHCLLDVLTTADYFAKWIDRIAKIPDFFLEDACGDVVGLGITDTEAKAGVDFLKHRRDDLRRIIETGKAEFRGISQWSLLI